ncbi:MAG: site-specific DNA-methyltransferase [Anaerolineales bacterium]|nr:site-specific DNA-methyltransferase [Anaerolineales bacterium]
MEQPVKQHKFWQDTPVETELKFSDLSIRIARQDCIEFLRSIPDASVELIVTDPAYSGMNEKLQLGRGRIVGTYNDRGENGKWFAEFADTEENYHLFLSECRRVLRQDVGHIYIMFDSYSLLSLAPLVRDYFDVKNVLVWDKVNFGMGHYFRRRHEFILFATCANNRKIRNRSFPDIWRFKRIYRARYATQKPVEVFQAMIYASAREGFTVCDPFMGAGSSAVAAIKNRCNFVGCDISEEAIELAGKRIAAFIETGRDIIQPHSAAIPGEKVFWE